LRAKLRRLLSALKPLLVALLIALGIYLAIAAAITVWAFETSLKRWPTYVFSEPFTLKVGQDIEFVNFRERLKRLGYGPAEDPVVESGKWSESVLRLRVSFRSCPLTGRGVVSGPVVISTEANSVRSIRLLKSDQEVDRISIEPELLALLQGPGNGLGTDMCRPIPLERINPMLVDAILLTEDTRFYSHWGIDFSAIVRAMRTNLKEWRYAQGGSTITQQLVRMTLLNPKKTLWRKINEMAMAVAADSVYSKKRILESYLNRVYLGQWGQFRVSGVAEASRLFFGKDTHQLDPAECAFLAATIKAPNVINPHRHNQRARSRRNVILGLMLKAGKISREDYDVAIDRPVDINRPGAPPVKATGFLEIVEEQLARDFPMIGKQGDQIDVLTSLDPMLQNGITEIVNGYNKKGGCLVAADQNGRIRAYAVSGPQKWDRDSAGPNVFAPLLLIPALSPEKKDPPRWTLTSPVFVSEGPDGSVTFREAFRNHKSTLLGRLNGALGTEKMLAVLGEFGVRTGIARDGKIKYESMSPVDVAQVYLYLASVGKAVRLQPHLTVSGSVGVEPSEGKRYLAVNRAAVFLVNHALMQHEKAQDFRNATGKGDHVPSVFTTQDMGGLWAIAYNSEGLVLLRAGGTETKDSEAAKIITKLLPVPQPPPRGLSQAPQGVAFRRICLQSGLRATSLCPSVINEPFIQGTHPAEWCQIRHQSPVVKPPPRGDDQTHGKK
jgi:penicillin-binding protein 1B